jgi:hypothetical protein
MLGRVTRITAHTVVTAIHLGVNSRIHLGLELAIFDREHSWQIEAEYLVGESGVMGSRVGRCCVVTSHTAAIGITLSMSVCCGVGRAKPGIAMVRRCAECSTVVSSSTTGLSTRGRVNSGIEFVQQGGFVRSSSAVSIRRASTICRSIRVVVTWCRIIGSSFAEHVD